MHPSVPNPNVMGEAGDRRKNITFLTQQFIKTAKSLASPVVSEYFTVKTSPPQYAARYQKMQVPGACTNTHGMPASASKAMSHRDIFLHSLLLQKQQNLKNRILLFCYLGFKIKCSKP